MFSRYLVLEQGRLDLERWWGEVHGDEIVAHEIDQLADESAVRSALEELRD